MENESLIEWNPTGRSLDAHVPPMVREYLTTYRQLVCKTLGDNLVGIYLHGSVALGAFDPLASDIDFVVVTRRDLRPNDIVSLRRLHTGIDRIANRGDILDGVYVPLTRLHHDPDAAAFPYFKRGRHRGTHMLGAVARHLLHERGVMLYGPSPVSIIPPVSVDLIEREMWYNLDVYWSGRVRRPWLFLSTGMVEFALATLPRILHTLETGEIIAKPDALRLLAGRFPRWCPLVDEVRRARDKGSGGLMGRARRARATIAMVHDLIGHANRRYR